MLDLEPGIHLKEVELPVLVEELDGPCPGVAAASCQADAGLAHGMADVFREVRGRALLQQLLVAPLDGTISFAQPDNMAVVVSQNLHLDMTRPGEEPLGVQLRTAEVRSGLATRRLH